MLLLLKWQNTNKAFCCLLFKCFRKKKIKIDKGWNWIWTKRNLESYLPQKKILKLFEERSRFSQGSFSYENR